MGDALDKPWSDNSYAPQTSHSLHFGEKVNLAGYLFEAIFYGIVIALFFQCMSALLNPADHQSTRIKWPLVAHTVATFLFATVLTVTDLDMLSTSFINNREFPGHGDDVIPPGPVGYMISLYSNVFDIVPRIMFLLNHCLADGLLLYRCCVIYEMNPWVIAFPCLVYLTSFAMGIAFSCQVSRWSGFMESLAANVGIPYFSISVSLNVLLTLMISGRLILHSRNIRNALGAPAGVTGLCKAIVTTLVESCALYAVCSLLFIASWAAKNWVAYFFLPILAQIQVIAPFLVILRVAKQNTSRNNTVVHMCVDSIRFESQERLSGGDETPCEGESTS